jgi:hypothetical protein
VVLHFLEPLVLFGIGGFVLHSECLLPESFTISHQETGARVSGGTTKEEAVHNAHERITRLAKENHHTEQEVIRRALKNTRRYITKFDNKHW